MALKQEAESTGEGRRGRRGNERESERGEQEREVKRRDGTLRFIWT